MTFTLQNNANQGLRVEYFSGGVQFGFMLGSLQDATFEADSLHPDTLALIERGVLAPFASTVYGVTETSVVRPSMVWRGTWSPGSYKVGETVAYGGVCWVNNVASNPNTPSTETASGWSPTAGSGDAAVHASNYANPHATTANQVGAIPTSARGRAGGVAGLDGSRKLQIENFPDLSGLSLIASLLSVSHPRNGDLMLAEGTSSQVEAADIKSHLLATGNPHSISLFELNGVSNDVVGEPGGVAQLDNNGKLRSSQLPQFSINQVLSVETPEQRDALSLSLGEGDAVIVTSPYGVYLWTGEDFSEITGGVSVTSVNGKFGSTLTLTTDDVPEGLKKFFSEANLNDSPTVVELLSKKHSRNTDDILGYGTAFQVSSNELKQHLNSESNPHGTNATQVGAIPQALSFRELNGDYEVNDTDNCFCLRFVADAVVTFSPDLQEGFQVTIVSVNGANVELASESLVSRGSLLNSVMAAAFVYRVDDRLEALGDFAVGG